MLTLEPPNGYNSSGALKAIYFNSTNFGYIIVNAEKLLIILIQNKGNYR